VLPLLTPWFIHAALDAAGSAERLGVSTAQAHALSDRSVEELVLGPGTFAIAAPDGTPFYDASERSHLADARTLLGIFLIAGGLGIVYVGAMLARGAAGRPAVWRVVARAGLATAGVVLVLGVVSVVAFDSLFTIFHQVFFPAGNWSFDPGSQRLVQLYPFGFWQIAAAALGVAVLLLALGAWLLGRWGERRSTPRTTAMGKLGSTLGGGAVSTHPSTED
jgi:integral membrane protein (TIGR01906 family)